MLLGSQDLYAMHVPLRKTLKLFLQILGMLEQIVDYVQKLRQESHIASQLACIFLTTLVYTEDKKKVAMKKIPDNRNICES